MSMKTGGIVAGTRLFCGDGFIPVEFIGIGDQVITRDSGMARVTEIDRAVVEAHFIRLKPQALDEQSPMVELLLPQDQTVFVRNWRAKEIFSADRALVKAITLVDGIFVELTEKRKEVVFRMSLSTPQILYAEGVELGSANFVPARRRVLHPVD